MASTLSIRRSLSREGKEHVVKEPKSRTSRRTITLPYVRCERPAQPSGRRAERRGAITSPVFCTRAGKHLDKKNVLRAFRSIVGRVNAAERKRAGETGTELDVISERIRFHDLRHTRIGADRGRRYDQGRVAATRPRGHRDHAPRLRARDARRRETSEPVGVALRLNNRPRLAVLKLYSGSRSDGGQKAEGSQTLWFAALAVVRVTGLEPVTPTMSMWYSSQLS